MNKKLTIGIYGIISILVAASCSGPAQNGMLPTPSVKIDTVEMTDPVYFDMYPGNIIALNQVDLNSEVSGFITDIDFQEGQQVKQGQKLYEIEKSKYYAAFVSAEASVKIAKANLDKVKKDSERYQQLNQKGMTTQQRLDYSETDVETAQSQLSSAEANLLRARTDLTHATITAPFDGTIGISMVKKGTFVVGGQTKLNTVSSNNPIAVDFVISEKEINRFLKLEQKKLSKYDSLFTIVLPDKSIYPYPGKILFLDRAVDRQTGTLKVRLQFPNSNKALRDGMSCKIKVENKNADKVIVIPNKSVVEQMGEYFVYVVNQDTAKQHKVQIGPVVGKNIIIYDGLHEGETFVVEGIQKLRDDVAVETGTPQPQDAKK